MPLHVRCPSCSTVSALPDSVRGKSVQAACSKCGQVFAVKADPPAAPPAPVKAAPPPSAPPAPVKAPPKRTPPQVKAEPKRTPPPARNKKAAPSPIKAKSQRTAPPARVKKNAFDFDSDPPPRRSASAKGSGKAFLGLLVGGLSGVAVLGAGVLAYFLFFAHHGDSKTIAQVAQNSTEQLVRTEDPPKPPAPVETPPDDKKEPPPPKEPPPEVKNPPEIKDPPEVKDPPEKQPPPPKPDPNPPPKPPVEDPPAPKVTRLNKTRDGATTLTTHPDKNLRFTAMSPDGKTLYTASWDNRLRIWDGETFDLKDEFELPKPDKQPNSKLHAALMHDGKSLLFAHWDILQVMDLKTKNVDRFEGMPNEEHGLGQILVSQNGLVVLTNWGTVTYAAWRMKDRKFISKLSYDGMGLARGNASALAADGSYWINAPQNANGVAVRSLPDLRNLGSWSGPEKLTAFEATNYIPSAPTLSPNGKVLAYAQRRKGDKDGGVIRVFDLTRRTLAREMPLKKYSKGVLDPTVDSIAISPDNKLLVLMDSDRWVHGYDLTKGTFLGAFAFPRPGAWSNGGDDERVVQFTNDGRRLIASGLNLVKVWDRDKLVWPDPLDPANQPEQMADKGPAKPPEKPLPKEPDENEYKNAALKVCNGLEFFFEAGGKIIRTQADQNTVWLDVDGTKVAVNTARSVLLRNKGNTVRVKTRRVAGQPIPVLVELQAVKLVAEWELQEGSVELKGARVRKVQKPHVWLTGADGKEHQAVIIFSTIVKDAAGKNLEKDDRIKIFKVGSVVDAVVGAPIAGVDHSNLLYARLVKE